MRKKSAMQRRRRPSWRGKLKRTISRGVLFGCLSGWPVVLKPVVSRLYHGRLPTEVLVVTYADGPPRLVEQMRRFQGRCPVLLQEYCPGSGYGVELLYDLPREVWERDIDAALNYATVLPTEGADALADRVDVPAFGTSSSPAE